MRTGAEYIHHLLSTEKIRLIKDYKLLVTLNQYPRTEDCNNALEVINERLNVIQYMLEITGLIESKQPQNEGKTN